MTAVIHAQARRLIFSSGLAAFLLYQPGACSPALADPAPAQQQPTETSSASAKADLLIAYDGLLDKAAEIAKSDIRGCMGKNRCGCRGVPPAGQGYAGGMWLADSVWTCNDGIIYFVSPQHPTDYLYAKPPGAMGVIPFFAALQEIEGPHAGNIPIAKYRGGRLDYGGMFDLTYRPRKNHRDEVPAGAFFVHAIRHERNL